MFNWYARARICHAYLEDVPDIGAVGEPTEELSMLHHVGNGGFSTGDSRCPDDTTKNNDNAILDPLGSSLVTTSTVSMSHQKVIADHADDNEAFRRSCWFTGGWTLQELIAPRLLRFYGAKWTYLGDRDQRLSHLITECTGLDSNLLGSPGALKGVPVAPRMSWMAHRQTTRKEDPSCCILGILGISTPLL